MRKSVLEKELQKAKANKEKWIKREKELEHDIRECNKEQAAIIMESYQISPEDLLELLKEHEAENKRILEERGKCDEKSVDNKM